MTNDVNDFVDNLFAIERFEFFANRVGNLDDIDDSNELDDQLKVLYQFKECVPNNVYGALTKLVKNGDYYLVGQFGNYSQGITTKEQFEAILNDYGDEQRLKLAELERKKKYAKTLAKNDWRIEGADRVDDYLWRHGLEGSASATILNSAVEADDDILHSIYKVYLKNNDKGDFFESLKLFGRFMLTQGNPLLIKIEELLTEGGMKSADIGKALTAFGDVNHRVHATCMEAKEMYEIMEDLDEFVDTIKALTKKVK